MQMICFIIYGHLHLILSYVLFYPRVRMTEMSIVTTYVSGIGMPNEPKSVAPIMIPMQQQVITLVALKWPYTMVKCILVLHI